jgi:plastocyanin
MRRRRVPRHRPAAGADRRGRLLSVVFCLLLGGLLAGCEGATAQPESSQSPPVADLTISSGPLQFDTDTLAAPAATDFRLLYVNEGPMPHNVAIYTDESTRTALFVGEVIETGDIVYEVPALPAGRYHFRCDLHREMKGTLTVSP